MINGSAVEAPPRHGSAAGMVKVERFGPGADATDFDPGDFILTHRHRDLYTFLISHGQRRRFPGPEAPFAHWSHAAMVVRQELTLVEAESFGVRRSPLAEYRDDEYHLVRLGPEFSSQRRARSVVYAEAQVGQPFGYLDMVAAGFYLLFGWHFHWVRRNHELCSSLVVKALQQGGLLRDLDPALTMPGDLAKAFNVRP